MNQPTAPNGPDAVADWEGLSTQIGPWPADESDPNLLGAADIALRCASPGPLSLVEAWGFPYESVTSEAGDEVAAIVTSDPHGGDLTDVWGVLARTFHRHGLWPVALLNAGPDEPSGLLEPMAPTSGLDALGVFAKGAAVFADAASDGPGDPFAAALSDGPTALSSGQPGTSARLYCASPTALLLTPVHRPADVPRVLQWSGAVNSDLDGHDISAVLAHWEEEFGAVLMELSADSMTLQVARPPATPEVAWQVAREHGWFCPDNLWQGGYADLTAYADATVPSLAWTFWWD